MPVFSSPGANVLMLALPRAFSGRNEGELRAARCYENLLEKTRSACKEQRRATTNQLMPGRPKHMRIGLYALAAIVWLAVLISNSVQWDRRATEPQAPEQGYLGGGTDMVSDRYRLSVLAHAESVDKDSVELLPGMVVVAGGEFQMGSDSAHPDEQPVHPVRLRTFRLDRHEVTNQQFGQFVKATGHVTDAERNGYAWVYLPGGTDFIRVPGTNWRSPDGPGSSIDDRMDHPVVCVSWNDASAYARWAEKRLPSEAEWEYAARAGGQRHFSADPLLASAPANGTDASHSLSHQHAPATTAPHPSATGHLSLRGGAGDSEIFAPGNVWQGNWPETNELRDGFFGTAPAGSFPPNDLGLHDMLGNVWEWTADWYAVDYYSTSAQENPRGPASGDRRVARGGSWFCSPNYCGAYNTHYRGASPPDEAFNNVGFRCVADLTRRIPLIPGQEVEQ